jgi:hypothetical protein
MRPSPGASGRVLRLNLRVSDMDAIRIKNDVNGNPRHVIHWLSCEPEESRDAMRATLTLCQRYERVLKAARKLGGRRFHNKQYGGGIVFTAYECELPGIVYRVKQALS